MFDSDPTIETTTATITKNQKALSNSASVFYQEDPFAPNFASASDQEDPFAPIKDTLGFTASDQHTTQDQAFDSVSVFYQEDPFAPNFASVFVQDPFAPIKDSSGFTASDSDTSDQDQDDWKKMTFEQYEEKCDEYFDNMDDYGESLEIPDSMFDCDYKFTAITTAEDEEILYH